MSEKFPPHVVQKVLTQEKLEASDSSSKDKRETSQEKQRETSQEKLRNFLQKLDKSHIGPILKDMVSGWLEHHLKNQGAGEAIFDKMREKKDWKLVELMEVMADIYLVQHPQLADKFGKQELSSSQLGDALFDELFQFGIHVNSVPGREKQLAKFKEVAAHFRQILKT